MPKAHQWFRLFETIGGGTGEHWDTMPTVECNILTLTLWVLHGKIEAKSQWFPRPRLDGAVPPLVFETIQCSIWK